jgi:serine beta-lactamase-like protein LACTB, mitochondrial
VERTSRNWIQTGLSLIALGIGVLFTFILALYVYMTATAAPLHPTPQAVQHVMHSAPAARWADAVEQARQIVRANIAGQNLPGLSVAVGVGTDIVWAEGFGWADLEKRTPVAPSLRFRTGGASMALTSAAVGLLLEKHRLNLDTDIQNYVPEFPEKQWPVTLRELMGHLAGVSTDGGDEEPLSARCEGTVDGLQRFADRPLLFEPETKYRYTTYGWILVSAAVEAAADEPFFTFMRTQIFEPLDMRDTVPDSATVPIPDRATFYYPRFAADTRYGPDSAGSGDYSCFAGAGAFLSTPSDLVRFGIAINSGTLLQPATVKMLQAPQRLASGEETGYGLGWDVETVPLAGHPSRMVGHDSEFTIGGTTSLMTFPERGLVIAVMSNISFADTASVGLKIAQVFAQREEDPRRK